jgi:hypothetical protein
MAAVLDEDALFRRHLRLRRGEIDRGVKPRYSKRRVKISAFTLLSQANIEIKTNLNYEIKHPQPAEPGESRRASCRALHAHIFLSSGRHAHPARQCCDTVCCDNSRRLGAFAPVRDGPSVEPDVLALVPYQGGQRGPLNRVRAISPGPAKKLAAFLQDKMTYLADFVAEVGAERMITLTLHTGNEAAALRPVKAIGSADYQIVSCVKATEAVEPMRSFFCGGK